MTYKFWINKTNTVFGGEYYFFKTFKVYWAYRWFVAKELDAYMSITPIKTQSGYVIENGNYVNKYI